MVNASASQAKGHRARSGRSFIPVLCAALALVFLSQCWRNVPGPGVSPLYPSPLRASPLGARPQPPATPTAKPLPTAPPPSIVLTGQADASTGAGWLVWASTAIAATAMCADLALARLDRLGRLSLGLRIFARSDIVGALAVGLVALCLVVASGSMAWYHWTLRDAPRTMAPAGRVFDRPSGMWGPPGLIHETFGPFVASVSGPIQGQGVVDAGLGAYVALFLSSLALWLVSWYRALVRSLGPAKAAAIVSLVGILSCIGCWAMQDRHDLREWVWRHVGHILRPSWELMATLERIYLEGPIALFAGAVLAVASFWWASRSAVGRDPNLRLEEGNGSG